VEVGVLFEREDTLGTIVVDYLKKCGYDARPNEPYSGLVVGSNGRHYSLMYGATSAAVFAQCSCLMIEVRQDLIVNESWRNSFLNRLREALALIRSTLPQS